MLPQAGWSFGSARSLTPHCSVSKTATTSAAAYYGPLAVVWPNSWCRFVSSIKFALSKHPRVHQTGAKFNKQVLWQLADEEEEEAGTEQKQRSSKRPAPTSTPLLGKNSRSPN